MIPQPIHTSFVSSGDAVYLPMNTGGFTVTNCPDSFNLARRIAACCNKFEGLTTEQIESMPVNVLQMTEFIDALNVSRDTYRDLCGELLGSLIVSIGLNKETLDFKPNEENLLAIDFAIKSLTKADAILGEKNGTSN